ncbi:hypothetical protein REPUB_Repub02eG0095600 [Reevesia pubescens]
MQAVKINIEDSVKDATGMAFAGEIIRDDKGEWMGGFFSKIGICSIITAELWTIFQGLKLCGEKGYRNIELDTYSL